MSNTQEISSSQDGCSFKSAEIDLLQSRFAALSHVTAVGPKRHPSLAAAPSTPASNLAKGQSEGSLEHHTPPYGDEDVVRKRQKGPQAVPEFVFRDKFLLNVQESYKSHGLIPFASSFDNTPTGNTFNPIPTTPDTETSVFMPTRGSGGERVRGRKGHSVAMMFLGHSNETHTTRRFRGEKSADAESIISRQTPVEDTIEVNEKDRSMKIERKSEEIQAPVDQIMMKPLVKKLGVSTTVSEESLQGAVVEGAAVWTKTTNPVLKPEGPKKLPEVIFTRYPRMAKYLNTMAAPENSMRPVISTSSTVRQKIITCSSILPPELPETQAVTACSGYTADGMPKNEIIDPVDGVETPIFEPVPHGSAHEAVGVQGNIMVSKMTPAIHLDRLTKVTVPGDGLVGTAGLLILDTRPVKPISPRRRLPERYAIPVTQRNESVVQKSTGIPSNGVPVGIPSNGVPVTGKTEEELLMEQLSLIDERFSRDSAAHPDDGIPAFSLSRTNSTSTETSIKFSISPAISGASVAVRNSIIQAKIPPQTPKKANEAGIEDQERFRRSMGPSPSPHTAHTSDTSTTNFGRTFAGGFMNSTGAGKGQQTTEWTITAGNWLNKFAGSSKPTPAVLPRSQPSVLARMHSVTSIVNDINTTDTDGIAPGEWIQPVGLSKKLPVKPKIGITAELAPLLFQPPPAPTVRSMVESVAGSVAGSAHQWTKVVANQSNNLYPKSIFPGSGVSIDRTASDIIRPSSKITKSSFTRAKAEAEENARAKEKEKVIMEWRERGFTEVGRMGETGAPALDKKQAGEQMQKRSNPVVFRRDTSESGEDDSGRFGGKKWISPREGGLFATPPRAQKVNRKVQEDRMMSRDPSPVGVRNRMASGHGSSPAPIQPPIRQQGQLIDPNVQELANILKTMQGANPKAAAKSAQANDSFAKSWQDFAAPQVSKVSQAPIISQTPMAREILVLSQAPVIRQIPVVSQVPMARQALEETFRTPQASMPPQAPSAAHRRLVDVEPPAYSGTFVDKRFATPEVFHKEVMTRAEKEKERDEALEALIKESREEADRKCHDSGSTARMKNRNIRVAAGITVAKNAKGEMDWIISNPPPPPLKSTRLDKPGDGSGAVRVRRHHR